MADKEPLMQPAQPPPPYSQQPPQAQKTIIVTQPPVTVYEERRYTGDHYFLLSVVLSFVCFFCGTWWALACTIPAIFMALNAQTAETRRDYVAVEQSRRLALYLNVAACITYAITVTIIFIAVIASVASQSH